MRVFTTQKLVKQNEVLRREQSLQSRRRECTLVLVGACKIENALRKVANAWSNFLAFTIL